MRVPRILDVAIERDASRELITQIISSMKRVKMDERKEAFDKAVAVMSQGMVPQGITPLVCNNCGFTETGHTCGIPGACGVFTVITYSVCEIRPK